VNRTTLTDGQTTVTLASKMLPGQVLEVLPGGTTHLRFGPLGSLLDVTQPEKIGLTVNDLAGHPQFHAFQPVGDGSNSWLQWHWEADFPVRHFRLAMYGFFRQEWQAHAALLVSRDGQNWVDATVGRRTWDEWCWIGQTPADFSPTQSFWVRFQLHPDLNQKDWPWTIGLSDFKIELWMDSEKTTFPRLEGLRYQDDNPAKGFRGLLDLDW
jgi:hypothetical protein